MACGVVGNGVPLVDHSHHKLFIFIKHGIENKDSRWDVFFSQDIKRFGNVSVLIGQWSSVSLSDC